MRTALIAVVIIVAGFLQYLLMTTSIQDLLRRPSVRGDNKVIWALVILCVPIAGALVYEWMGPTSFRNRPRAGKPLPKPVSLDASREFPVRSQPGRPSLMTDRPASAKITPIGAAPSRRARDVTSAQERIAAARAGRTPRTGISTDTPTGS